MLQLSRSFLFLSTFLLLPILASNQCPEKWRYFEKTDSCFHLHNFTNDENGRWEVYTAKTAEEKCKEIESHLASIHSKEEDDFVYDLIKSDVKDWKSSGHNPCFFQYAWIGLRGNGKIDFGSWTDGTPVGYSGYTKEQDLGTSQEYWKIGNDESCKIREWASSKEEAFKNARFVCKTPNKIRLAE